MQIEKPKYELDYNREYFKRKQETPEESSQDEPKAPTPTPPEASQETPVEFVKTIPGALGSVSEHGIHIVCTERSILQIDPDLNETLLLDMNLPTIQSKAISFSYDAKFICFVNDNKTLVFNLETNKITSEFYPTSCAAFSPVKWQLISASRKEIESHFFPSLKLIDNKSHTNIIHNMQFSPDGGNLATVSWDKTVIIWNTESWNPITILQANENHLKVVKYSPSGSYLATGGNNSKLRIWNCLEDYSLEFTIHHPSSVIDCCWSRDDRFIAVVTSNDLLVWDLEDKTQLISNTILDRDNENALVTSNIRSCYSDPMSPLFGVVCTIDEGTSEIRFYRFPAHFARVKSARKTVQSNLSYDNN